MSIPMTTENPGVRLSRSAPPGEQCVRTYPSLEELEKQAHAHADQLRELVGEGMAVLSQLSTVLDGPQNNGSQDGKIAAGAACGGLSDALLRQSACIDQLNSIIKGLSAKIGGRRD